MHGEVCMGALIIWLVIMVPVSAILMAASEDLINEEFEEYSCGRCMAF